MYFRKESAFLNFFRVAKILKYKVSETVSLFFFPTTIVEKMLSCVNYPQELLQISAERIGKGEIKGEGRR